MEHYVYKIVDTRTDCIVARYLDLDIAIILLKALMNEWYEDKDLSLAIKRDILEQSDEKN